MPVKAQIQFRRGTRQEWIDKNPILDQGEPGYETDTGRYKIGNGILVWTRLQYATDSINPILLADNSNILNKTEVVSPEINFKTIEDTDIFTVPDGFEFLIDSMEVITKQITTPNSPPTIRFGNRQDFQAYYPNNIITSNETGFRHVIQMPQNAIDEGVIVTIGVILPSSAASHSGYGIVRGNLLPKTYGAMSANLLPHNVHANLLPKT